MLEKEFAWSVVLKLLMKNVLIVTLKSNKFLRRTKHRQLIKMVSIKKTTKKSYDSKQKSIASKKGWVTRRLNANAKKSNTKTSRQISSEKLKKLQREEKIRNTSRRNSQKKGQSLHSDKPKLKLKKPIRLARKQSKKRVSVR